MDIEGRFKIKLQEISNVLDVENIDNKEVGVLSGISGVALFQFYYSKFTEDDYHADKGVEIITKAIDIINTGFVYPTFCTGIAGACWVLEILKEEGFIELEDDFMDEDLDLYLLEAMKTDIESKNYDFLHGALGYGYYFLKRYQNTTSIVLKDNYKKYLEELIKALKKSSKKSDSGVWWESVLKKEEEIKGCNLGLSHGISSMVNFLSRLAEYEDFYIKVEELLRQTVRYIMSCKNEDTTVTSSFPNWVLKETLSNENSRLAWCYGDLGIGISILRAAEILKDDHLKNEIIKLLKHSVKRTDTKEAGIIDAGLCHGVYGVLHIYNYLYRKTKDITFKEASDFWAHKALDMAIHKQGYAGYMVWRGGNKEKWEPEVNLLEGIAGIGLSILSYIAPFDTKWDECLLIG